MTAYEIINKKKRGQPLNHAEIKFFVDGFLSGAVLPEQAAAFCMAVCYSGMDTDEVTALTLNMAHSGEVLNLSGVEGITADKHSTGGVGDTTTFIVVPVLAALGLKVAKMSGRGLGHTGGTLDKLEAFDGYNVNQSPRDFFRIVGTVGASIIGQTLSLAPADKKLYALRDITCTVDSIPLIASSVMSKKLAAGASVIVLDVKYGSGAFMKTADDARALAECMVKIGNAAGRRTAALISDMNQPLSVAVGSNLEINEAIETLKGKKSDLYRVSVELATRAAELAGADASMIEGIIKSGAALDKFRQIIEAHGGRFAERLPVSDAVAEVKSGKSGVLTAINTEEIGLITSALGGGRMTARDTIDHTVGIKMHVRLGARVQAGDVLAVLYGGRGGELKARLNSAFIIE